MKNCGRRFHNEVGKFRFLNELIKVVSPKVSWQQFSLFCSFTVPSHLPSYWLFWAFNITEMTPCVLVPRGTSDR